MSHQRQSAHSVPSALGVAEDEPSPCSFTATEEEVRSGLIYCGFRNLVAVEEGPVALSTGDEMCRRGGPVWNFVHDSCIFNLKKGSVESFALPAVLSQMEGAGDKEEGKPSSPLHSQHPSFFVSVHRVVRNVCTILFHALRVFHSLHQYCVNTKQTKHRRREARGWEVVDDVS